MRFCVWTLSLLLPLWASWSNPCLRAFSTEVSYQTVVNHPNFRAIAPKVVLLGQAMGHEIDQAVHLMNLVNFGDHTFLILTCEATAGRSVPGFDGVVVQIDPEGMLHTLVRISLKKFYRDTDVQKLIDEAIGKSETYSTLEGWHRVLGSRIPSAPSDNETSLWSLYESLLEIGNPSVPLWLAIETSKKTTLSLDRSSHWIKPAEEAVASHNNPSHAIWNVLLSSPDGSWVRYVYP